MNNVAQEKMTEIVEKLISKIENNETGLWSKSWISGGGLPSNYSSKTTYSGFNILSLMFMIEEENWSSNQFLTFNQIRKIKGAKLKKGSLSTPVFFFKMLEKKEIIDGVQEKKTIPLLKFFYVYNLDQVEGIEIGKENDENLELDTFVTNCNVEIKTRTEAFYSPSEDYIGMPKLELFKSTEAYASTILHELAHSTGHDTKLGRDMTGSMKTEAYAYEECIAELSSMFLCNHLNIQGEEKQAESYIKSWLIDNLRAKPKLLWKIASESQKIFNFLLESQIRQEVA